jgi:hypothetical protein
MAFVFSAILLAYLDRIAFGPGGHKAAKPGKE